MLPDKPDIFKERAKHGGPIGHAFSTVINKLEAAVTDKSNPLHPYVIASLHGDNKAAAKIKRVDPKLAEMLDFLHIITSTSDAFEKADREADKILALIETTSLEDFSKLQIDGLTLLSIIQKGDENLKKQSQKIFNSKQSEYAKSKRPSRQHPMKSVFLTYYERWKQKPELYQSRAQFIKDMLEKTDVTQEKTIRAWINELDS